ncbi:hypothetical protein NDU88_003063 [Pleurodeles waltl]|uniref:Uncharacterized protein n=1 Tax=Pleurodeles waltl TaxID=8319 RepID=A0AAV7T420_PLEWA|nr:hypothetical protein NDU88_003063 [Pleurodeles waltl]
MRLDGSGASMYWGESVPALFTQDPPAAILDIGGVAGQHRLAVWPTKGILTIGDIFEEGRFLTYEALANAHNLGHGWFIASAGMWYMGKWGQRTTDGPCLT